VELREAIPADVHELVELWIEFMDYHSALDPSFVRAPDATTRWADYIAAKLSDPAFQVLVADGGDSLAGYVVATVMEYAPITTIRNYGFVTDIAVREAHRRGGVGRQLFEAAERWLLSRGVSQIEVKVDVLNPVSRAFWNAAGFTPHTETLIKKYPGSG
jgi:GNAT superfamily N-acetyltransferase